MAVSAWSLSMKILRLVHSFAFPRY